MDLQTRRRRQLAALSYSADLTLHAHQETGAGTQALDPNRPIREVDIMDFQASGATRSRSRRIRRTLEDMGRVCDGRAVSLSVESHAPQFVDQYRCVFRVINRHGD
jgi:hypothetical protein